MLLNYILKKLFETFFGQTVNNAKYHMDSQLNLPTIK